MEIEENGPLLVHADNLLNQAMNKYCNNSDWHFIKTKTEGLLSEVIDRLKKEKSKHSFGDI